MSNVKQLRLSRTRNGDYERFGYFVVELTEKIKESRVACSCMSESDKELDYAYQAMRKMLGV